MGDSNCNLLKNAQVGCQRSAEEGIAQSLCLSLSASAAKRAKEKPGLSAAHILRPGLKRGEARSDSQVTRTEPGELGAEFGVGGENKPGVLRFGVGQARRG